MTYYTGDYPGYFWDGHTYQHECTSEAVEEKEEEEVSENSKEIISLQESSGLLNQGYIRVGNTERGNANNVLFNAHKNGYLDEDQYKTRRIMTEKAATTQDLQLVIRDLPKPQKGTLDAACNWLEEMQEDHTPSFHIAVQTLLAIVVTLSWVLPSVLIPNIFNAQTFNGILVIPIVVSVLGVIGSIVNTVYWVESS
jgi:hypothetical protein